MGCPDSHASQIRHSLVHKLVGIEGVRHRPKHGITSTATGFSGLMKYMGEVTKFFGILGHGEVRNEVIILNAVNSLSYRHCFAFVHAGTCIGIRASYAGEAGGKTDSAGQWI